MLNSPNNPTGRIIDKNDIQRLREIVQGTDILILSDEVYEHIIFDGMPHESILKYPDLFERSFSVFSFGKVFHCTGWKTGYCIAPDWLMKEFLKVHQYNCFCTNTPMQYAFASFLQYKSKYLELGTFFQEKRDYFKNLMAATQFKPLPSFGSYFQLYSYSGISNDSEIDFAKKLTEKAKVATIPVSAFYQKEKNNQVLRFCFAKKETTLEEVVNRLINFQNK
jgi:methionine aminotransferase